MSGRDNRVRIRAELDNAVSKGLTGIRKDLDNTAKSPGAKALLQGAGMELGRQAYGMLGDAISGVTDLVGESTQAYIEDEASQSKLRTSLRANVDAYDGNSDAIERVLAQRMALGFSDDEQRGSLAELVGAYKDANVALDRQRLAMDLARYSGVSLAEAGDTLIKVHAGNYRALKSLGISTEGVTNEYDALSKIQAVVNGQAEAYTQTVEGRLLVAQTKEQESLEKLGATTAKLSADFEEAKAGAFEDFAIGLSTITDGVNFGSQSIGRQIELLQTYRGLLPGVASSTIDAMIAQLEATKASNEHSAALEAEEQRQRGVNREIDGFSQAAMFAAPAGKTLNDLLREMGLDGKTANDALDVLASTISNEVFGDAINDGHLADLKDTHKELVKQRDAAKEGTLKWRELTGEIAANEQAQFDLQLQMAEQDGPQAVLDFLDKADKKYGANNTKLHTMIGNLRDVWAMLRKFDDLGVIDFGRYAGKTIPGMAEGGIVKATPGGTVVRVGEAGHDEAIVPLSSGAGGGIGAGMSSGDGGGPVELVVQLDGAVLARVVDARLFYSRAGASRSRLRT